MKPEQRGYCNRILRVNLSSGRVSTEPLPEQILRPLLGGKGLGAYYLFNQQSPGVEALSPDNNLIFNVGLEP